MNPHSTIRIWEDSPIPFDSGDGYVPLLDCYLLPGKAERPAILICPGGGYAKRSPHEGHDVALKFNALGYHAFVVQYRVSPSRYPAALSDASRSIRIIRKNASVWNVRSDAIAIIGFSAGGHLSGSMGVFYKKPVISEPDPDRVLSNRPNACILCYSVISSGEFKHASSFKCLLGENADDKAREEHSIEKHVTSDTPPTFLWHTADDSSVAVENSLLLGMALRKHRVNFELHVFPKGMHGLGIASADPHVSQWVELCHRWLLDVFKK